MKRAISVRKAALMIATVWNTSAPDKGFMSCLASCEALGVNHLGWKMFRFQTQVGRCERRQHPRRPKAWSALRRSRPGRADSGSDHVRYAADSETKFRALVARDVCVARRAPSKYRSAAEFSRRWPIRHGP
jgi:hypothetical protein